MNKKQRYGTFYIRRQMLEQAKTDSEVRATISDIFSKCIIVRAELMFATDEVEYRAYSDAFDEIDIHEVAPKYEWLITLHGGPLVARRVKE
ncbi:MAG TPA: hypothetical protein V6C58_25255 [Allocoleopsis sp.]